MTLPIDLQGKTVAITGGSMGIGAAAVRICYEAGAHVAYCARGALGNPDGEVLAIAADVSDPSDVRRFFEETEARLGKISAVIHAAAVLGPIGNVCDVDPVAWLKAVEIDLYGSFLVVRESCQRMRSRGGGRIALFSGGGASGPFPNYTAYACSKVGVVRLTETVAQEMQPHGIEINCVAPGFVATQMHNETLKAGRAAAGEAYYKKTQDEMTRGATSPDLGARAAAYLVSDAARGITGKFVSALHDDLERWSKRLPELNATEIFTLRRVLPRERGMDWQ